MKLIIRGKLPSLNDYTNECRLDRYAGASMKKQVENLIGVSIRLSHILPVKPPIILHYRWYEKDMRRDFDNITFAQKFVQDALVRNGIIPDDNRKIIPKATHEVLLDKKNPRIEVEIEEIRKEKA